MSGLIESLALFAKGSVRVRLEEGRLRGICEGTLRMRYMWRVLGWRLTE